ncbi:ABC transporter permease [Prescottella agglutinans]|uniref:ABC-2 type transport system permease protein n=1 Tax=Prescottella agglutinans TaxID=1644129 RepID=A0ABT6M937_9NOCA|nr:ABC transporter permease [Prescottella agglutinans]MDH6280765.1 ABC-2 type transport system permease protein [Prescottella agglutinans]
MTTLADTRSTVRWGGFNTTLLRLELRRLLRNRRTVIFTLVMPVVFFLIFGLSQGYQYENAGRGNVTAYIMISMALYGAMIATTSGGAMVSVERASGWSRQLRLTPLSPVAYIAVKLVVAMTLGLVALAVVYAVGAFTSADMDGSLWVTTAVIAWLGSSIFAAFGLFMGYLLPSENVMQILGPGLALLAFGGGLFIPLQDGSVWATIAQFTPMYGIGNLVHAPLTGDAVQWTWIANVVVWLAIFVGGAVWRFQRDTARV